MHSYLSNGQLFVYTPDHEIVQRYDNGMSFRENVSRLASTDRISKTAAKRRVFQAVLKSQIFTPVSHGRGHSDPFAND